MFDIGRLDMFTGFEQSTSCGRLSEHESREWIHTDVFLFNIICEGADNELHDFPPQQGNQLYTY